MHQHRLHGVTDARTLHLGVDADRFGHGQVGVGIHVGVADACEVLDDGDPRFLGHPDQPVAAPGDNEVDVLAQPKQFAHRLAVGGARHLHCILVDVAGSQRLADEPEKGVVGVEGLASPTQDDGVAALHAEGEGVHGDVGPRFVDEEDDADGHAHLGNGHPVGPGPFGQHLTNRVG